MKPKVERKKLSMSTSQCRNKLLSRALFIMQPYCFLVYVLLSSYVLLMFFMSFVMLFGF